MKQEDLGGSSDEEKPKLSAHKISSNSSSSTTSSLILTKSKSDHAQLGKIKQEDSDEEKPNFGNSSSLSTSSNSSASLVPIKTEHDCATLSQTLQAKLDKLVTVFDQLIFKHEISSAVIERHFGNKLMADELIKDKHFWECFIGALIRKLGVTADEAFMNETDFRNLITISIDDYKEVEAGWIWRVICSKLLQSDEFRLPSVGDFQSYVAKFLDNSELVDTELENIYLMITIFVYLYPLRQLRELFQFKKQYILSYMMDQIVDTNVHSLQTVIYVLYALQRVLEASVLLTDVPNYQDFQRNLKKMSCLIPEKSFALNLDGVENPYRAMQASMLSKITLKKLDQLNKLKSLPVIKKEHELISLCYRNWFCGSSSGYCTFQLDQSVLDITKKRHLYFEIMHLTNGSIKVGICNDMNKLLDSANYGMTTCEYSFSFDAYKKESSRDNHGSIPMVVRKIFAGTVVGVRLDTMERSVTYYIDGDEIKEKRKPKSVPLIRSKRSWESNPYYVTISLATMQQAMILIAKEEWVKQPNFEHDLDDLYYDHWKFRMVR